MVLRSLWSVTQFFRLCLILVKVSEKSQYTAASSHQSYKHCQALVAPVRYWTEVVLVDEGAVENVLALPHKTQTSASPLYVLKEVEVALLGVQRKPTLPT